MGIVYNLHMNKPEVVHERDPKQIVVSRVNCSFGNYSGDNKPSDEWNALVALGEKLGQEVVGLLPESDILKSALSGNELASFCGWDGEMFQDGRYFFRCFTRPLVGTVGVYNREGSQVGEKSYREAVNNIAHFGSEKDPNSANSETPVHTQVLWRFALPKSAETVSFVLIYDRTKSQGAGNFQHKQALLGYVETRWN